MHQGLHNVTDILILSLALCWAVKMAVSVSVPRPSNFVRQRRALLFPYGFDESYLEFIFGFGLPMDLPHPYTVLMSIEIRADYAYPVNATDFTDPKKRKEEKEEGGGEGGERNLPQTYDAIETDMNSKRDNEGEENVTERNDKNNTQHDIESDAADNRTEAGVEHDNSEPNKEINAKLMKQNVTKAHQELPMNNSKDGNIVPPSDVEVKANKTVVENQGNSIRKFPTSAEKVKSVRKRAVERYSARWRIYHILELAANNLGMDGRACLLRSICDAAATPLHHHSNGLIGELLHVLFTPSTSNDDRGRYSDTEYYAAEQLGNDINNNCGRLYPECDASFLDIITRFDL